VQGYCNPQNRAHRIVVRTESKPARGVRRGRRGMLAITRGSYAQLAVAFGYPSIRVARFRQGLTKRALLAREADRSCLRRYSLARRLGEVYRGSYSSIPVRLNLSQSDSGSCQQPGRFPQYHPRPPSEATGNTQRVVAS
jgi:hypothetical protein